MANLEKVPKQLRDGAEKLVEASDKGLGTKHGTKPICAMFPPDVEEYLRSLPNRSDFIREAVAEKMEKEGKKKP